MIEFCPDALPSSSTSSGPLLAIQVPVCVLTLEDYIERQGKSRKPATVAVWKQVVANLKECMPAGIKINQITAGHAKEFHEKLKARGMATTTIHKRIQFARQFMHDAVDWKIID